VSRSGLLQANLLLLSHHVTLVSTVNFNFKGLHFLSDRPNLLPGLHRHLSEAQLSFCHLSLSLVSAFTPVKDYIEQLVVNEHVKEVGSQCTGLLPDEDILFGPLDLASADLLSGWPLASTGSAFRASTRRAAQAIWTPRTAVASPALEDFLLSQSHPVEGSAVVR